MTFNANARDERPGSAGAGRKRVTLGDCMLARLIRLVRILHATIGISDPKPGEELPIALAWVALVVAMVAVFVIGLFYM